MDTKRNYLTTRIALKVKPNQLSEKFSPIYNSALIKYNSNRRIHHSNPFDSMINNGKANPSLLPVLNIHKKNPSMTGILTERTVCRSLQVNKSECVFPKIFKQNSLKGLILRPGLKPFLTVDDEGTDVNMKTPCFSNVKSEEQRKDIQKVVKIETLAVKSSESFNEFSFGETEEDSSPKKVLRPSYHAGVFGL